MRDYWRDLWRYRELFGFLAWRDVISRYKQTVIGVAWSIIRPAITIAVFTVVFGKVANLPSGGAPYPLLVCAGTLPWQLFASAFTSSSDSVVANSSLVSKVYFPRMIIPASATIVSLVDFVISFFILIAMMLYYHVTPTVRLLAIPFFSLMAVAAALSVGLWFAATNVKYRDVRHIVPFAVQLGLFLSPVGYNTAAISDNLQFIYALNPVAAIINGFRWAVLGSGYELSPPMLAMSVGIIGVLFIGGLAYFRRMERMFADII